MIRTFLYLALAGLLVLAALQIADIPGEVAFDWQGWRIVLPAPLLVLALIIFAAISALIYRIWRGFTRTPGAIVAAHRRARRERGYRALTQGMVAVAAGDAQEARRQAKRADVLLNEPPLTMLLSAQTAQLNGDEQAAKRYFTAMLEREETAFLGLRGLLIQAQKDGDRAEAMRLAERARRLQPKTPWVLGTLYDLHVAEKDWRSAAGLLDGLAKSRAINGDVAGRRRAALALLRAEDARSNGDDRAGAVAAKEAFKSAPGWLPAIIAEAAALADGGKNRNALRLIERSWAGHSHPALAEIYRRALPEGDAVNRVQQIEKLVAGNEGYPQSQIALARAMLDAYLWGSARTHLEKAAAEGETVEICRLMARLEEGENKDIDAANRWLRRAAEAKPDPGWQCDACGGQFAKFSPDCPGCGALGTLEWGEAPGPAVLSAPGALDGAEDINPPAVIEAPVVNSGGVAESLTSKPQRE